VPLPSSTIDKSKNLFTLMLLTPYSCLVTRTHWKLKQFMELHRIHPGDLARATGGELSRADLYRLLADERPTGIHFSTLDSLLPALEALIGQPVEIADLINYEPEERLSVSGQFYTGDPETDALLDDAELVERLGSFEQGEVKMVPWSQVKAAQRAKRGL
jgi:DNA-binding Xre family transcriptional regulator